MYKLSIQIFSGFYTPKIIKNRLIFDRVIGKIKGRRFLGHSVVTLLGFI